MSRKVLLIGILLSGLIMSCSTNPLKVNLSDIKDKAEVVSFGKELMSLADRQDTLQAIAELSEGHPEFFDLFTHRIIRIGGLGEDGFPENLFSFVSDTMIQNVNGMVNTEFRNFGKVEKQLVKAFKYHKYHFPEKEIPVIYTYISGFNQSVVTFGDLVGISLDKYLGRECRYYKVLSTTPRYKALNMYKERIPSDVMLAWSKSQYDGKNEATNLLGNMIHQGKLMYFVDAMLPETHDSIKIGYTSKQLQFCENNEPQMWSYLVEQKMLYSNNRMDIIRYVNDAPTTSGFPLQSPGRAGIWIGWQIVRKFMEEFPETSLEELMENTQYQEILSMSKYFPE